MFLNHIYLIYMNKADLALNNHQWLVCHKTKQNQNVMVQLVFELTYYDVAMQYISHYAIGAHIGSDYFPWLLLSKFP